MVSTAVIALAVAALGMHVYAAPAPLTETIEKRASVTVLSSASIAALTPYTYYASTGYCSPAATLAWNCGSAPWTMCEGEL